MRLLALSVLGLVACGANLPSPPRAAQPRSAFTEVPYPPPPARAEIVPKAPDAPAVWIDGSWEWTGNRWRWRDGGWFARPPSGVYYTDWAATRPGDERLLYANAGWRDRTGAEAPAPRVLVAASGPTGGGASR